SWLTMPSLVSCANVPAGSVCPCSIMVFILLVDKANNIIRLILAKLPPKKHREKTQRKNTEKKQDYHFV
ncbi:hypothetical protein ACVBKF_01290, partial [Shewanella sp. 0m-11]